jgi:hypothetical protein
VLNCLSSVPLNSPRYVAPDAIQRASELTGADDLLVLVDDPEEPHASAPHALMQAVKSSVAEGRPVGGGGIRGRTVARCSSSAVVRAWDRVVSIAGFERNFGCGHRELPRRGA